MTREITHMKAFTAALESMGKSPFSIGQIPPTPELVNQYFNDSTGVGDEGETDSRGPWNQGGDWEFVEAPAFQAFKSEQAGARTTGKAGNGSLSDDGESQTAAGQGSIVGQKTSRSKGASSKG
jgi:Mn-containing catalase